MKPITFTVRGNPVPQPRARITTRGKFAHAYTPKKHPVHSYRQAIQLAAIDAGLRKTSECVEVIVDAVFQRPKSHSNKRGLKADAPPLPKPDVDNIAKAVLDAVGPILGDDRQVRRLISEKSYGMEARTTVRIQ